MLEAAAGRRGQRDVACPFDTHPVAPTKSVWGAPIRQRTRIDGDVHVPFTEQEPLTQGKDRSETLQTKPGVRDALVWLGYLVMYADDLLWARGESVAPATWYRIL